MLVRIVKLTFNSQNIASFEQLFEKTKTDIRNFDGCLKLELYRDKNEPNIFFTYSHWRDVVDLEHYRNSVFFKGVWAKTKVLFSDRPEAWSVDIIGSL